MQLVDRVGKHVECDDFDAAAALAAGGLGVALAPEVNVQPFLDRGELVRVLPEIDLGSSELCLMWPVTRHLSPRVRAFVEHCVDWVPRLGLDPASG